MLLKQIEDAGLRVAGCSGTISWSRSSKFRITRGSWLASSIRSLLHSTRWSPAVCRLRESRQRVPETSGEVSKKVTTATRTLGTRCLSGVSV
ncbi:hypothetical protein ACVXG8_19275 [Escherichia coli]